uniref:DUF4422 domain-containing protein n=1 Tax=Franconibacter helveticus TaxID=357240 RepID=UPI00066B7FB0
PKKILLKETLEEHYKKHHIAEHYDIMIKVISNNFNYLSSYAEKYSKEKTGYFFNMFILNSKYFEVMSSELFRFCGIIEENIGEVKSKKEERYVGYLCERFINFYLHYLIEEKKIKYMELDVLFVNSESFYGI